MAADRFTILLVGHGRLGQLIAAAAPTVGATVAGTIDDTNAASLADRGRWRDVDVAIDVSAPEAFVANLPALCALGCSLVVGTTGWQAHDAEVRQLIGDAGIGAVVSANFSVGATLMDALTERAAKLFGPQELYGAFVHETHHAAKKDAPSGTALLLKGALERGGFPRPIDVASTRVGFVPGIHAVGFDGPAETLTLTHTVRDRATFAHGALVAARWVRGRRGWFTMRDVLESDYRTPFTGCGTALVPRSPTDGALDEPSISASPLQVEAGIHSRPSGTTARARPSTPRATRVGERCRGGRGPVPDGRGRGTTPARWRRGRRAGKAGAQGILSVSPYTPSRPRKACTQH